MVHTLFPAHVLQGDFVCSDTVGQIPDFYLDPVIATLILVTAARPFELRLACKVRIYLARCLVKLAAKQAPAICNGEDWPYLPANAEYSNAIFRGFPFSFGQSTHRSMISGKNIALVVRNSRGREQCQNRASRSPRQGLVSFRTLLCFVSKQTHMQ